MAITLVGSTITIDSGIAAGTATGGSANTLTGTGFNTAWVGRILYLTGGTGATQSRAIKSVTATTITVWENWTTPPNATTTYIVSHDVADIVGVNGAAYVGDTRGKTVRYDGGGITINAGAVFGGLKSGLMLGLSDAQLVVSGLLQFGHAVGSEGRDGGFISLQSHGAAYIDSNWTGRTRLYGCLLQVQQGGVAAGTNKLVRINQNVSTTEFTAVSSTFTDVVIIQKDNTTLQKCRFVGERSGFFTGTPNAVNQNSIVFSGILSPRNDTGFETRGAVEFDVTYLGAAPSDPFFNTPVFLNAFNLPNSIHYYVNTTFPTGYASAFRWYTNIGNGRIYEAYSVRPMLVDSAGTPVQGVLLSLLDASGSAGWWTSKDASFEPVKTATLTTNASGTITSTIGTGEAGLVIRNRWTRTSEYVSGATGYGPFTFRARKYGFNYVKKTGLDYTSRTTETIALTTNTLLTQTNSATVAAYTTLETSQKFYDYVQYWMSLSANVAVDVNVSRVGALFDAGSYNVVIDATAASVFSLVGNTITIKASTYTGDMTTTGLITLANGATFNGTRTDSTGTTATTSVTITNGVAGTRLLIQDVTNPAAPMVLYSNIPASFPYTWTGNVSGAATIDIRVRAAYQSGTTAKMFVDEEIGTLSVASPSLSYRLNQVNDAVYIANGIDGAAVTGITIDDPTLLINVSVPTIGLQSIYAYETYWLSTSAGILDEGRIITAPDTANYIFEGGWKIKNISSPSSPLTITGGYMVDATTGIAASLIDNTGGTIILAPDHVIPYATGSGVTPQDKIDIADAVLAAAQTTPIQADIRKVNNITVDGVGTEADPFGPA